MDIKVGSVVELKAGIFGGMRGVVTDMGAIPMPEGDLPVCRVGVLGMNSDIEFYLPATEFNVIGEVR